MDGIRLLICVENDCVAFALKLIVLWIQFVALGICYACTKCSVWFFFSSFFMKTCIFETNLDTLNICVLLLLINGK